MKTKFKIFEYWHLLALLAIIATTFIIYFKILKFGFLSDDFDLFFDYKVFLNPFSGYRWLPIQGAIYWLIHLGNFPAWPVRSFFLLLHLFNIILVYKLVGLITKKRSVGLLSAFVFALFYRNPQEFNNMVFMLEVALVTFFLLTMLFYYLFLETRRPKFFWLSFTFFLLALLCKESAILLPGLLGLMNFVFFEKLNSKNFVKWLRHIWPIILLSLGYLIFAAVTSSSVINLTKAGYHRIGLKDGLANYVNILAGYLPIKYVQQPISQMSMIFSACISLGLVTISLLTIKTKFRIIAFYVFFILLTAIPYAFFSPFGYYEKYLHLGSIGFAGLLAYLVYLIVNRFGKKIKISLITVFVLSWGVISYKLIGWRLNEWQTANVQAEIAEKNIVKYCSDFNEKTAAFFVNFPAFVSDNQVFNFNNGLGNMIRKVCGSPTGTWRSINLNKDQIETLKRSPETNQNHDLVALVYDQENILDYSKKYYQVESVFHQKIMAGKNFSVFGRSYLDDYYYGSSDPVDTITYKAKAGTNFFEYSLEENSWVFTYFRNYPIQRNATKFSFNLIGDDQKEKIYFDWTDNESENALRFIKKIAWENERHIEFNFTDGEVIGKRIDLGNFDNLKISIDSEKDISGKIEIRDLHFE